MYGYESSAALTTDRLRYTLQTRPLVREAKNTSTAVPASRQRRREGNPVQTVMYGYESSAPTSLKIKTEQIPHTSLTSTRRTSGHCLGTFRTANFVSIALPNTVMPLTSPPKLSLPYLSHSCSGNCRIKAFERLSVALRALRGEV
jgi:hypothetical protein